MDRVRNQTDVKMQDISQLIDARIQFRQYQKNMNRQIRNIAIVVGSTILLVYVIFGIAIVNGVSMEPSLYSNDILILWRLSSEYDSGDIVTISGITEKKLVKRVVGVPGDVISKDRLTGELLINGQEAAGIYQLSSALTVDETDGGISYPLTLGKDEYFCLGDNRNNSEDSRYRAIGVISKKQITGRAILIIRRSTSPS